MKTEYVCNSDTTWFKFLAEATSAFQEKKWLRVQINTGQKRTLPQNNAIHKYLRMVADELNENGFPAYINSPIFKKEIEVDWTMEMVKQIWVTVQVALFPDLPASTSALERSQVTIVYDHLNRAFIDKTDGRVTVMFPTTG